RGLDEELVRGLAEDTHAQALDGGRHLFEGEVRGGDAALVGLAAGLDDERGRAVEGRGRGAAGEGGHAGAAATAGAATETHAAAAPAATTTAAAALATAAAGEAAG